MSKNTESDAFRKLRVELFDGEETYQDDKTASGGDSAAVAAKETKCRELVNQQSSPDALKIALADPPLGGDDALKDRAYRVVMDVLNAIKSSEIKNTVSTLSPEEKDVLMKYVYRGMAAAEDGLSASLLLWHGAIVAESGLGSIVRVLSDRKTV
mmetsp:Transcript_87855/g.121929  ORF Transcript_87855/g.121929 Transcript_87855/m.121929 type:complete len:154 (+) Transcript_87855:39-500(+)